MELFRFLRSIDWLGNFIGADVERNVIKIAIAKQDVELLKAIAQQYAWDADTSKWVAVTKGTTEGEFTNIAKFGGTPVTGRDITGDIAKLQNLNITTAALRDALKGASAKDFTTLEVALSALRDALRGASTKDFTTLESQFILDASGLPKNLKDFYLKAVDITVESGHTWYIASGEEFAATKVTNNGRIWNAGTMISLNGIYDGIGIYDGTGIYK